MIIIGLTKPNREEDYSPLMDGYRPGADQDTVHLPDVSGGDIDLEDIAEAVFEATNSPEQPTGLAGRFREIMEGAEIKCRSLSVGDTVTVEGLGMVACERSGWNWVGMHGD